MGPTGTDVGRGTAAGYVNLQSKAPTLNSATSALFSYGTADQKRLTVDFDQRLPLGEPGSWLSRSAVRLNGLWQDGGVPGRDDVVTRAAGDRAVARARHRHADPRPSAAQIMRQDNVPDYGIPGAAWDEEPLAPTTVIAARPVDSEQLLRQRRLRLRQRQRRTAYTGAHRARRQRAADAAQPDPLQPD